MKPSLTDDLFNPQRQRPFVRRTTRYIAGKRKTLWGVFTREPNRYEHCAAVFESRSDARNFAERLTCH